LPLPFFSQDPPGAAEPEKPLSDLSEDPFTVSVDVDLALFNVTVVDDKDRSVTGLTSKSFRVFEDNREQEIRSFQHEAAPSAIGLVIDNSSSMMFKRTEVISAAMEFAASVQPRDEMFVVNFSDGVSLPPFAAGAPFTDDYPDLRRVLLNIKSYGRTALYDAIAAGLRRLDQGENARKALVILSDGGDNASALDLDDIVLLARQSQATLFTIGFYDATNEDRNPKVLRQLSELTGGESFVPRNASELRDVWLRVAARIRSQYTIGYISSNPERDGLFRKVRITAVDKNGKALKVRTRAGYVASKRESQVEP
jgi:Ca-activated chloride channel family protein